MITGSCTNAQPEIINSNPSNVNTLLKGDFNESLNSKDIGNDIGNDEFLNKKLKSLYRRIVQICHPDKHPPYLSDSDKKSLLDIYNDCTGAVRDKSLYFFLESASRLHIEIPDLDKSEILILENNCAEMEDSLKKIKNTYPWVWGENDDEEHRRKILDLFIQENK